MLKKLYKIIAFLFIIGILIVFAYTRYPISYTGLILESAQEFDLDPCLVAAVINVESRYDKYARSNKDARGLMQLTRATASWGSEVLGLEDYSDSDLYDPAINIRLGSWYISRLKDEFDGDLDLVLAAYNGGSGNVKKWLQDPAYSDNGRDLRKIPFEETENYLKRIDRNYRVYKRAYGLVFLVEKFKGEDFICFIHSIKRSFEKIGNKIRR